MKSLGREHSYAPRKTKSREMPKRSIADGQKRRAIAAANSLIVPIILAAGKAPRLRFPKPLARFGMRSALEIAVENCAGLATPIVVLGHQAERLRGAVPRTARVVVHRGWRSGQVSSLCAGLRRVRTDSPFLLYSVDYPLLTPAVIRRLVTAFKRRSPKHMIIVPTFRGRRGHPVIFSPAVRAELTQAHTARQVVEKDPGRVKFVPVGTAAIQQDFDTPTSYRRCRRAYLWQRR